MLVFITVFLASLIQGVTGFGFALVAVPLLSIFIPDFKSITPIIVIYSLITNLIIGYKTFYKIQAKSMVWLMLFGIIGTPIGIFVLMYIKLKPLKFVVGIVTAITALAMLKNFKVNIKNEKASYGIVGVLSGILNGSAGLSGPPVVLFLTNQNTDKDTFKANLAFYGIAINIFAIVLFAGEHMLGVSVLHFTITYFPALIVGVLGGIIVSKNINEATFRLLTVLLICILGLYTAISAI